MPASAIPTTGWRSERASSSAPGSPKALTITASARRASSGASPRTASAASSRSASQVMSGAPNGTVSPSICRLTGAHSRAISTMSVVSNADVFGLTRTIRFMKAVPAERAAALHFCGCGPGLSLLGQSAHESGYPPSRRDKKGGDETPIAKSPRR